MDERKQPYGNRWQQSISPSPYQQSMGVPVNRYIDPDNQQYSGNPMNGYTGPSWQQSPGNPMNGYTGPDNQQYSGNPMNGYTGSSWQQNPDNYYGFSQGQSAFNGINIQNGQNEWYETQQGPYQAAPPNGRYRWWGKSPEAKKRHSITFWTLIGTGGVFVLICLILLGFMLFKLQNGRGVAASRIRESAKTETDKSDFWADEDNKAEEKKDKENTSEEYERDIDGIYGITPDADYYSGLVDSINTTTDYLIEWEEYYFTDPDTYADIYIIYPRLLGDNIPNLEELNENLEAFSMSVMDFYAGNYLPYAGVNDYLDANSLSYVTYNDDTTVSIVVSEFIDTMDGVHRYLYCLNLDLVNGIIVWNTDLLEIDDAFLKEFRKQIALQNGWNMEYSNQELYQFLNNEDTLILYYTPVGLEVGINFIDDYGEVSWVSATIKDYYKFSKFIG